MHVSYTLNLIFQVSVYRRKYCEASFTTLWKNQEKIKFSNVLCFKCLFIFKIILRSDSLHYRSMLNLYQSGWGNDDIFFHFLLNKLNKLQVIYQ